MLIRLLRIDKTFKRKRSVIILKIRYEEKYNDLDMNSKKIVSDN